jgi:hypothetical protein
VSRRHAALAFVAAVAGAVRDVAPVDPRHIARMALPLTDDEPARVRRYANPGKKQHTLGPGWGGKARRAKRGKRLHARWKRIAETGRRCGT